MKNNYLNDTFAVCWRFTADNTINYCVVKNSHNLFLIFKEIDTTEINNAYVNIKLHYSAVKGKITIDNKYYVIAHNNYIHSNISPAILCPAGLDTFKVGEDVEDYLINGRKMQHHEWKAYTMDTEYKNSLC
jgi:hypothetical protein